MGLRKLDWISSNPKSSSRYEKLVSDFDFPSSSRSDNNNLPGVIQLRSSSVSPRKKCRCPSVSRLHQIVVRKLKGACSKVIEATKGSDSYLAEFFTSNQLLVHFNAAPVAAAHRRRKNLQPTLGFTKSINKSNNSHQLR